MANITVEGIDAADSKSNGRITIAIGKASSSPTGWQIIVTTYKPDNVTPLDPTINSVVHVGEGQTPQAAVFEGGIYYDTPQEVGWRVQVDPSAKPVLSTINEDASGNIVTSVRIGASPINPPDVSHKFALDGTVKIPVDPSGSA